MPRQFQIPNSKSLIPNPPLTYYFRMHSSAMTITLEEKATLIDKLLANGISHTELILLRENVDANDLSVILQRIYDLNESHIFRLSAVEERVDRMNRIKNRKRNERFMRSIRNGFRDPGKPKKQVILAEGDSWFNYPILLTDVIDRIGMDPDLAVYSIASGGDWLLNMLSAQDYVEELSILHPDVFLISAGGNDLVGSRRLATILEPGAQCAEFGKNEWAQQLLERKDYTLKIPLEKDRFDKGCSYLSKDFFALLMFFHLQYYFLMSGILEGRGSGSKFPNIRIITQGYDYAIPSYKKKWGINPLKWYRPIIRSFLGHGSWLKTPMQLRGITNEAAQKDIVYSMIYLFNEMMIEMGGLFNRRCGDRRVCHIDSRTLLTEDDWTDELHPTPAKFMEIGSVFVDCIKNRRDPDYGHVYIVKDNRK